MSLLRRAALPVAAAGLGYGLWTYAARSPGSQLFGRTLIAGRDPNEAALTFDDGPNGDTTLRLLDLLARHQARATFFLIGRFVRQQPEIVRAIAQAGHLIGNHTVTHPPLHRQSAHRIREELAGCSAALEDTLGQPVRFFRAPHGARRPYVLQLVREMGMVPVQWNVMGVDWKGDPAATVATRVVRGVAFQRRLGHGSNILLHDGGDRALGIDRTPTLEAVERLLVGFRAEGIRLVGVDAWQPRSEIC